MNDYTTKFKKFEKRLIGVPVGEQMLVLIDDSTRWVWEAAVVTQDHGNGDYVVRWPDSHESRLGTSSNVCVLTGAEAISIHAADMLSAYDGRPITMYTPGFKLKEEPMKEEKTADAKKNPPNPKARFGDMKRRVDLVPPALELGAAVALKEGAGKYGPFNWRINHVESMTYAGAIKRHIFGYIDGEDVDPESKEGKLHLEGIAASCAILLDSYYSGILIDNRPPKGPAPALTRAPGYVEKGARYEVVGQTGKTMFRVMDAKPDDGSIFRIIADNLDEKVAQTICAALNAGARS